MIRDQFILDINEELIIDNFAGGGGASTGIELALGRHVDVAINHDPKAIAMHQANHPQTLHKPKSVWEIDPLEVTQGRPVGLAWFSPDCKHFSKAKGGKPREKAIRMLAWIVVRWIIMTRPRTIMLENVEEFQDWCPLKPDGQPDKEHIGRTFECFRGIITTGVPADHPDIEEAIAAVGPILTREMCVQGFGYSFGAKELRACDHGAPTIRKRLFVVMHRDGSPAIWPEATHAAPADPRVKAKTLKAWLTAANCIDFSIPCPSIFERTRPLAHATFRRIAKGIMRFVVNAKKPFIVHLTHQGDDRVNPITAPLPTVTGANRGEMAVVSPHVTKFRESSIGTAADEPLHTITAGGEQARPGTGNAMGLVSATLVTIGYGEREGQAPRAPGLDVPLGTVVAGGIKHALITPTLVVNTSGHPGAPASEPLRTVATGGHQILVAPVLTEHYGGHGTPGSSLEKPMGTVTAKDHHSLITAQIVGCGGPARGGQPRPVDSPAGTLVTRNHSGLAAATLTRQFGTSIAADIEKPAHTVMADGGGKTQLVKAFLVKYYGNEEDGISLKDPLHTVTTLDRFGLVSVEGVDYAISDIGLRMLQPRELFRAQGFPDTYIIERGMVIDEAGKVAWIILTKSDQVRMCGNSVCPPMAKALVEANCPGLARWDKADRRKRLSA